MAWGKVRTFGELVKWEHTIFALPFAYVGSLLAAGGWPRGEDVLWITAAMFGARTSAMALNRLIDRHIDAMNPRTANRHLPRGLVSNREVLALAMIGLALLGLAAWELNPLCAAYLPLVVAVLVAYSYTKRFTWTCHLVLGLALSFAPMGGWVGVTGAFHPVPFLLSAAVALWVAGFDIIYATQDIEFDRFAGLHSIPARFGVSTALLISRLLHVATVGFLVGAGLILDLSAVYYIGVGVVAALLLYEHSLISTRDLSRVNAAFFNVNGVISLVYLLFVAIEVSF